MRTDIEITASATTTAAPSALLARRPHSLRLADLASSSKLIQIPVLGILSIDPGGTPSNHLGVDIQVINKGVSNDALVTVNVYHPDINGLLESQVS